LNGGTMKDPPGNDATLTFTTPNTTGVLVDTTPPSVSSINRQNPTAQTVNASSVIFRVTFNESVSGLDTTDFSLTTTATATGAIASVSAAGGTTIDVTVNSVGGNGTLRLDLNSSGTGITDAGGNAITAGFTTGQTYIIDTIAPSLNTVTTPSPAIYRATQNLDFTASYDESVVVTGIPTISLTVGSTARTASYTSGTSTPNLVFRYTVVSGDNDTDGIIVASPISGGTIKDAAGNAAGLSFTEPDTSAGLVDGSPPAV